MTPNFKRNQVVTLCHPEPSSHSKVKVKYPVTFHVTLPRLMPTSPKTKPQGQDGDKKTTRPGELQVYQSVPESSLHWFSLLIHQLFHLFLLGVSDRAEETRPGLCPRETKVPDNELATQCPQACISAQESRVAWLLRA